MITTVLQQLGLSINEAKIYEALLDLKEARIDDIAFKTNIHRRNIYDTLKRLVNKGLVFPLIEKGANLYSPVDPDKLLELIKEKELQLKKILPDLKAKFQEREVRQEAYIYRRVEGFKNYMRDILRVGKDVIFIGGKLTWFSPQLKMFTEQFFKEVKRKKISIYGIFDAEAKGKEELKYFPAGYKFLPLKYATDSAILIYGDYVVMYTGAAFKKLDENITIFVLRDIHLAKSYKTWFDFLFLKL